MKLSTKILIPVIFILCISIIAIGLFSYYNANNIALFMMNMQLKSATNTVVDTMNERLEFINITKEALNEKNINIAKAVAEIIALSPQMLETENVIKLSKKLGVDEIHIADNNGILVHGTHEAFFGYKYDSSEQSKVFLKAIKDKNFELAQDPTPRGVDKKLFQYIGVARIDEPGIVQIGIEPIAIQKLLKKTDLQGLVERIHIGQEGYAAILDKNGIVIAHPIKKYIGVDIKKNDWGKEILSKEEGLIRYEYDDMDKYVYYKRMKDYIVLSAISVAEFLSYINNIRNSIILITIVSIFLVMIIIAAILRKVVIQPLNKLVSAMDKYGEGDLTVSLDIKSNDEIGKLSSSFNKMIEQMKSIINNVKQITDKTRNTSKDIMGFSEQVGASSEEVSRTIQEIAAGASSQAEETSKGFDTTNKLTKKIEDINEKLEKLAQYAVKMKQKNKQGSVSMSELEIRFAENTQAVAEVAKDLEKLSEKSNSIGAIIETIRSIAEQTNLLALNAAIEAARAGEQGRGFAIVADEVRKLAEQSTNAAEEIQNIIQEIIEGMYETNNTMTVAGGIVEKANDYLKETKEMFDEMKESTEDVVGQIEELNEDIIYIDKSKENVLEAIENISSVAQQSAAATEQISASAQEQAASIEKVIASIQEIDSMIEKLYKSLTVFKI